MINTVYIVKILKTYRIPFFYLLQKMEKVDSVFIFDRFPGKNESMLLEENPLKYKILKTFALPSIIFKEKRFIRYFPLNLIFLLYRIKPDIIFCPEYSIHTFQAIIYKYFFRVKIIIWSSLTKYDERISFPFQKKIREFLRKNADAFLCYSLSSKEYLKSKKVKEEKLFLVENCTDVTFYYNNYFGKNFNISNEDIELLYVGALEKEKGLLDLFYSLEYLLDFNWKLKIVGSGRLEQYLVNYAYIKLKSRVTFLGELKRNDLIQIYSRSNIFIFPSYSDVWGHVIDEAMACGCCVIASDCTIAALELIQNNVNGILFRTGDVNELKAKLLKIFQEPKLISKLGQEAHITMSKHNEIYSVQGIKKAIEYVNDKKR